MNLGSVLGLQARQYKKRTDTDRYFFMTSVLFIDSYTGNNII